MIDVTAIQRVNLILSFIHFSRFTPIGSCFHYLCNLCLSSFKVELSDIMTWSPYNCKCDIEYIEKVQRQLTKWLPDFKSLT